MAGVSEGPGTLVFVGSNTTGSGESLLRIALGKGYDAVVLSATPERHSFVERAGARLLVIPDYSLSCVLEEIRKRSETREIRPVGVTTSSEFGLVPAALAAKSLGLPARDYAPLVLCRNKLLQRLALLHADVRAPRFVPVLHTPGVEPVLPELPLPFVLKPLAASGSEGVRLIGSPSEFVRHLSTIGAHGLADYEPVALAEEHIVGAQYSVECFDGRVVAITANHLSEPPLFIETGHDSPAVLDATDETSIRRASTVTLQGLGLVQGPAHLEFRMRGSEAWLIEANARVAGGLIPELVRRSLGVDLLEASLAFALGTPVSLDPRVAAHCSIRFLVATGCGHLLRVEGLEVAPTLPHVVEVGILSALHQYERPSGDFRDRVAYVMTEAVSPSLASTSADVARSSLRIVHAS